MSVDCKVTELLEMLGKDPFVLKEDVNENKI